MCISKYLWVFDEPDDWFSYYEEKFTGNWKKYFELGKILDLYNSGSIHFALKNILLDDYINDLKYEQIIFTRFDQFYLNKHSEFSKDFIWIQRERIILDYVIDTQSCQINILNNI